MRESGHFAPASAAQSISSGETATGPRRWIWAVGGAAVVVIAVAAFWLGGRRLTGPEVVSKKGTRTVGAAGVTETNSLAVLPFANMSSDKDQEYFSDGLTEELLNALAKIPDLKVAGRTSSFSFKGKNEDLRTIGQKLGVANILEGSVRKSGNRVRITAQLVKASDGFHLWSETYDRTLDDIFAVQDDIAKAVTQSLKVTLLGATPNAKPPSADAYDLVLQARFFLQINSQESIRRALERLERALKLSPNYAPAWAEMGLLHMREQENATSLEANQRAVQRAREALTRALELDPDLAMARSRLATVQQSDWEFAEAERTMAMALAADPKNPIVLGNAAALYANLGRLKEAISFGEETIRLEPFYPVGYYNLANMYVLLGRLDEAEALIRKAIELRPDDPASYISLGQIQLLRHRPEEARLSFAKFTELIGPGDYFRLFVNAQVEHTAGNAEVSKRAAEEFEKRFGADDPSSCAQIRAWRGEADAAFAWLEKALARRDPWLKTVRVDPWVISMHADPRWNALLKKIGLPTD